MAVSQEHTRLLDQLQTELNGVLEHTGRIFTAARSGGKAAPAVRTSRLKREFPRSVGRFHDALDELQDEIHRAKAVMRRDLALCREKASQQALTQSHVQSDGTAVPDGLAPNPEPVESDAGRAMGAGTEGPANEDVEMKGSGNVATPNANDAASKAADGQDGHNVTGENANEDGKPPTEQPPATTPEENRKGPHAPLHIDTNKRRPDTSGENQDQAEEADKPPDTGALSTNADLDSLFNDTGSTNGGGGETGEFGLGNDFDFESFSANLDNNSSSLVPSFQPGETAEPDFSAIFSTDEPLGADGQGGAGDQQPVGPNENGDSTFDDLMEDFNLNNYNGSGNEGDSSQNQDFDFSF